MTEKAIVEETLYNSTYQHGIDEKRRVQIPAKWRPSNPDTEFTLILWDQPSGMCLRVLPPHKMLALMQEIDAMANGDPKKVAFKRIIGIWSTQVTLDKAGRICLPEKMAQQAGVKNEAVLVGCLDRFEIWSPERFEATQASDAVMAKAAFDLIA